MITKDVMAREQPTKHFHIFIGWRYEKIQAVLKIKTGVYIDSKNMTTRQGKTDASEGQM